MLGPEVNQDLKDLILSSCKSLQFLCNNIITMWVSLHLKQTDAALPLDLRFLPHKECHDLKNSKFLGSDLLFPQERESFRPMSAGRRHPTDSVARLGHETRHHHCCFKATMTLQPSSFSRPPPSPNLFSQHNKKGGW